MGTNIKCRLESWHGTPKNMISLSMFHLNSVESGTSEVHLQSSKPKEAPIYTKNYPFLSKYLNSISWPSPFKVMHLQHSLFLFDTDFLDRRIWIGFLWSSGSGYLAYGTKEEIRNLPITLSFYFHSWKRIHIYSVWIRIQLAWRIRIHIRIQAGQI